MQRQLRNCVWLTTIPSDRSRLARQYAKLGVRRLFAAFRIHETEVDDTWPAEEVQLACKLPCNCSRSTAACKRDESD
jgi:hypothetical protein